MAHAEVEPKVMTERIQDVIFRLEGNPMRQIGAIYKKGKVLSPAMRLFIELLKKSL